MEPIYGSLMGRRRYVKQTEVLEDRLADQAKRLREKAAALKPGQAREELLRLAQQAEQGAEMSEWLRLPAKPK